MHQGQVSAISPGAAHSGVRLGMRIGGVSAIAPGTVTLERSLEKEALALDAIAMALLQYTPEVTLQDDFSILMDVSASLRLFKGPHAICGAIARSIAALGFTARLGAAPTAQGAWLLARSFRRKGTVFRRRALTMKSLERLLDRQPCGLLTARLGAENVLTPAAMQD